MSGLLPPASWPLTRTGAWAELVVVPARRLVQVPDGLDPADAVALVTNGVTAFQLLSPVRAGAGR